MKLFSATLIVFFLWMQSVHAGLIQPPFTATSALHWDIIKASDPTAFVCMRDLKSDRHTVWDKRINGERKIKMYTFSAYYDDQDPVAFVVNQDFASVSDARDMSLKVAESLGMVPKGLRKDVGRVAIHSGDEGFHAGGYTEDKGQIVLYREMIKRRIDQKHLEESLFHESVHASWDRLVLPSEAWREVQRLDKNYITGYAKSSPDREDLAETALLVYGKILGRLRADVVRTLENLIPLKTLFITDLLEYTSTTVVESDLSKISCE